jgi:hypothetical protein
LSEAKEITSFLDGVDYVEKELVNITNKTIEEKV